MKKFTFFILLFFIFAVFTIGCTSFEGSEPGVFSEDSFYNSKVTYESENYEYASFPGEAGSSALGYTKTSSIEVLSPEQKILKTADIKIEVVNVSVSAEKVKEISKRYGGLIQSLSVFAGKNNRYSGKVTLRIPEEFFDDALAEINSIGTVLSSSVSAEDITEEFVDLVAQRDSLTNQLAQYNRLLLKGQNVTEILIIQKEIERVQLELDRIVGRMKYLDNRIKLSTISISLSEPAQVMSPGGYSLPGVISDGIAGFVDTVVWLFVAVLTLLPIILLGGAGYWIYRRRKKQA